MKVTISHSIIVGKYFFSFFLQSDTIIFFSADKVCIPYMYCIVYSTQQYPFLSNIIGINNQPAVSWHFCKCTETCLSTRWKIWMARSTRAEYRRGKLRQRIYSISQSAAEKCKTSAASIVLHALEYRHGHNRPLDSDPIEV